MTNNGNQIRCFPDKIPAVFFTGLQTLMCIAKFCLGGRVTFVLPETVDNQGWNPGHRERVDAFIDNTIALIKRAGMNAHRGTQWTKAMTFDECGFLIMTVANISRRNQFYLTMQTLLDCAPNQVWADDYESLLQDALPYVLEKWTKTATDDDPVGFKELKFWVDMLLFTRKSGIQIDAVQDRRLFNVEEHQAFMDTIRQRCQSPLIPSERGL